MAQVVCRKHRVLCLLLSFLSEGHMHRHLVTIEVSVKCRTDERVQLDRATLNQHGLKRLDT